MCYMSYPKKWSCLLDRYCHGFTATQTERIRSSKLLRCRKPSNVKWDIFLYNVSVSRGYQFIVTVWGNVSVTNMFPIDYKYTYIIDICSYLFTTLLAADVMSHAKVCRVCALCLLKNFVQLRVVMDKSIV